MSIVLEMEDVSKVYGRARRRPALDRVGLAVAAGEVVALLGPSGSGKSSLLHLAAGLDRPTAGRVTVTGQRLDVLGEATLTRFRGQRIGFVLPSFGLLAGLRVLENVLLPARLAKTDRRVAAATALELLGRLDLAGAGRAFPDELDDAERQLVALARSLVNRPSLVVLDEPAAALGGAAGPAVVRLLAELGAGGAAVVVATRDPALAGRCAQRVVSLADGRVAGDIELPPRLVAAASPGDVNGHPPGGNPADGHPPVGHRPGDRHPNGRAAAGQWAGGAGLTAPAAVRADPTGPSAAPADQPPAEAGATASRAR